MYVDKRCDDIVGGNVANITSFTDDFLDLNKLLRNGTWDRQLQVISVPYKEGSHVATKLTDFIPIIQQLQALHGRGYVHGDIRAFNVVFGREGAGLIDFDLSGKPNTTYPPGYKMKLLDGDRIGNGEAESRHNKLEFWHDWYALGKMIFQIHIVEPPLDASVDEMTMLFDVYYYWRAISETPDEKKIGELILHLERLEEAGFSVKPNLAFEEDLTKWQNHNMKRMT